MFKGGNNIIAVQTETKTGMIVVFFPGWFGDSSIPFFGFVSLLYCEPDGGEILLFFVTIAGYAHILY